MHVDLFVHLSLKEDARLNKFFENVSMDWGDIIIFGVKWSK